ncbi:MAG: CPBP family intramembrane metalloprotease [Pleurocapsa sp. MO_226.B13]|nr:CPBP family intramembrane metalloprotease [Pleurocapsa sp. MO_226.B13]
MSFYLNYLKMFDTSWLKVCAFFGVWTIIWLPIALIVSRLIDWQPGKNLMPKQKLILLASLYLLTPLILVWKIKVENLSWASLGLSLQPNISISILLGLAVSLVSLAMVFSLESIFNLVDWHWENSKQLYLLLLPILALSLAIGLIEELVFRGYVFSTLVKDYSYWFAATASSIIFAVLHLIWEQKKTIPQLPGLWLMGMILVGARLIDNGSIGLALGLHAGWIWGLTCMDSAELLSYNSKNSWLTGIDRQPLAGVAGIFCLVFTGLVLLLMANMAVCITN